MQLNVFVALHENNCVVKAKRQGASCRCDDDGQGCTLRSPSQKMHS